MDELKIKRIENLLEVLDKRLEALEIADCNTRLFQKYMCVEGNINMINVAKLCNKNIDLVDDLIRRDFPHIEVPKREKPMWMKTRDLLQKENEDG